MQNDNDKTNYLLLRKQIKGELPQDLEIHESTTGVQNLIPDTCQ